MEFAKAMKPRWVTLMGIGLSVLFVAFVSASIGRYPLGMSELLGLLLGKDSTPNAEMSKSVVLYLRAPRILAALLVGAGLSASGAAFQSLFLNPLVSPGILGALSGASFGALLGMLLGKSWILVLGFAFLGGGLDVLLALSIAAIFREEPILMLILGGIVSSALFASLTSIVKMFADPYDKLPSMVYWLMGGLSNVEPNALIPLSPVILACIIFLMLLAPHLNLLSQGEEEAKSLGVNTTALRLVIIGLATLTSTLTVLLAGVIQGVGLVIPHIARMVVGPDNRTLIPTASLLGGLFLLIVDDVSRTVFSVELPLGITSSFVGIAFFVIILRNARKGWG
jgi:iron complex transport system permease protein